MKVNHNQIFKYYQKGIYSNVDKLYAFGDIHGDYNAFILSLKKTKLIDNNLKWIGKTAHVVQVGDILDRKIRTNDYSDEDSEFKIISLILKLQLESYIEGGGFHPIIGNHELLNIFGVFDYVSEMGFKHFDSIKGRAEYFKIGGDFCKYLACAWNPIVKIGDFIFCHGGISYNIANKYSIEEINFIMRDTLYGNKKHINKSYFNELFLNDDSILWNRSYSSSFSNLKEKIYEKELNSVLKRYNANYMVVGHSPQPNGINIRFNKVFCIDTCMSKAFGSKKNENERLHYLEIIPLRGEIIIH
jgi:hypothetical protein